MNFSTGQLLLILLGFLIAEILLFILVNRGLDHLKRRGILPETRFLRGLVLLGAMLLPMIYAAFAISGAVYMMSLPDRGILAIGQVSPTPGETAVAPTPTPPVPSASTAIPTPENTSVPIPDTGSTGSPQGKIVYTCQLFKDTATDQICMLRLPEMTIQRITANDYGDYNYPSLSPDGKSIIFTGKQDTENYVIYEISLDGNMRQINQQPGQAVSPEISPDGQSIVYTYNEARHNEIWEMNRDGSTPRRVFGQPQGDGWDPSWSPDGSRILFTSSLDGTNQLYSILPDGTGLAKLTQMRGLRGRSDWSPDGKTIATYAGEEWHRELFLIDLERENARQLTQGGNNLAPSFSPDGGWITFVSYRDHPGDELGCEIYIMRLDGNQLTRLTDNDICDWQPRWGP